VAETAEPATDAAEDLAGADDAGGDGADLPAPEVLTDLPAMTAPDVPADDRVPQAAPPEAPPAVAAADEDTPRPRAVPAAILAAAEARAKALAAKLAADALAASAPEGVDLRPVTGDTPRPRPRAARPDEDSQ
jgi:hypothetical protein